jgi:Cna protein B-type domain.
MRAALLLMLLIPSAPVLRAQSATGEVMGTITDRSGGGVPGAAVKLINQGTQVVEQVQTQQSGSFLFIGVRPGSYTLTAEMAGFKTAQVPVFSLSVNQTLVQNITLDVGTLGETITVSSEAPLLQQASAELGTVIAEQAVHELPLNGRNFTQLMLLTPGANPVSTAQGSTGVGFQDAGVSGIPGTVFSKPSLHGQQNRSVLYYLDGIINTDFRGSIYGVLPIIDAMDEFKVQSHNEKTEFGGVTGGVVNMVSKSGTNDIHGSAWEFVRNNAFDARNPFTDFCNPARCGPGSSAFTAAAPVAYHQNEFGAAGGGPIIRNKTFFYAAYEGWRYNKAPLTTVLLPTAAELSGDFSHSFYTQQIYDPSSTVCAGGTCTRQPFANNVIPQNLILPAMQSYLNSYLGRPNFTGIVGSNYIETRAQTDQANSWQIRLDQNFNERNTLFFRLSQMWVTDIAPVAGTTETTPSTYHAYNFGGGYYHAFRPNLILDVRAGAVLKPYVFNQAASSLGIAPATSAGFKNVEQFGGMVTDLATPYVASDTGQRGNSYRGNPGVNWDAGLTWIVGKHNIKTGAQFIYVNRYQNNLFQQYTFADAQTSNAGAARTGNSLASALLGLANTYTGQLPQYASVYFRFNTWAGYVQDEWKIKPNLTVNLGLRYDYLTSITPLNGRLSNDLDLFHQKYLIGSKAIPACDPNAATFVDPCIPGGIGSVPFNQNIVFTGKTSAGPPAVGDNVGPRAAFAWGFARNTVLRAGYGVYFDTVSARSQYAQNTIEGPTWPWTTGIGTQNANFATGGIYPGAAGNPLTSITSLVGNFPKPFIAPSPWTSAGGGYNNDPSYKNPLSQQWNVEIQRQLGASMMLSVAYVGSKNTRLDYTGWANAARQASPVGTPLGAIDSLKLMPFMVPNWHYTQSIGIANYNGLEMKFERRFSNGLLTLLSYTWSRSLDNSSGFFAAENGSGGGSVVQNYFTPHQNYGVSGYNVPQLLTWSTVYDIPVGRGRRYLNRGPLSWVLGNWGMNYVFIARSGQPFNLVVNGDIANISGNGGSLSGYGRPNLVGDPTSSCSSGPARSENCFFNPAAFATPTGSFGNFGKDVLHNEAFYGMDLSLVKNIPLGEKRAIQLRFEGFNVFNFQILGTPGTTIGQSTAGVVSTIASTPRQLQIGAKVSF